MPITRAMLRRTALLPDLCAAIILHALLLDFVHANKHHENAHAHVRGTYAYALCCGEVRHGVTSGVARDISKNRLGVCFKEV